MSKSHRALSPEQQLIVTLRYLATGISYRAMVFHFRISHNLISIIVRRVCKAIWEEMHQEYLSIPETETWQEIANGFEQRWQMPNCIGLFSCIGAY